jgi:hypothetical protein
MANKKELRELFKDIADAIRTKEGSTELISAKEFPQRISNLSGGGGSSWRYFDISNVDIQDKDAFAFNAFLVKGEYGGNKYIDVVYNFSSEEAIAIGFDCNAKLHFTYDGAEEEFGKQPMTMNHYWETFVKSGMMPSGCVEITEEEFYNVN